MQSLWLGKCFTQSKHKLMKLKCKQQKANAINTKEITIKLKAKANVEIEFDFPSPPLPTTPLCTHSLYTPRDVGVACNPNGNELLARVAWAAAIVPPICPPFQADGAGLSRCSICASPRSPLHTALHLRLPTSPELCSPLPLPSAEHLFPSRMTCGF